LLFWGNFQFFLLLFENDERAQDAFQKKSTLSQSNLKVKKIENSNNKFNKQLSCTAISSVDKVE
jgi:hypothetical protein